MLLKSVGQFLTFCLVAILLASCTSSSHLLSIQKRKHLKGFYIQKHSNKQQVHANQTLNSKKNHQNLNLLSKEQQAIAKDSNKPVIQEITAKNTLKSVSTELAVQNLEVKWGRRNLGSTQIPIQYIKQHSTNIPENEPPKRFKWYSALAFLLGFLAGIAVSLIVLAITILIPFLATGFDWIEVDKPNDFTVRNTFNWAFILAINFMITLVTILSIAAVLIAIYMSSGLAGLILAIVLTLLIMSILAELFDSLFEKLLPFFFIGWGN